MSVREPICKVRAPAPTQRERRIERAAKPFTVALTQWLTRFAREQMEEIIHTPSVYADLYVQLAKKDTGATSPASSRIDLERLLLLYGLRQANTAGELVAGQTLIAPSLFRDAVAGKPVEIKWFWELQQGVAVRVKDITEETKTRARESVRAIVLQATKESPRPGPGEVARRIRTAFTGPEVEREHRVHAKGAGRDYIFSSDRAAIIARTELAQAENTGIMAGYAASGVEEIEWLAYNDGRSGDRHHEKMNGVRIKLGEYFVLPSGAKLRYPADPSGPISETINCRCTLRAVRVRGAQAAPAPIAPAASPAPAPAPAPAFAPRLAPRPSSPHPSTRYPNEKTAPLPTFERASFDAAVKSFGKAPSLRKQAELRQQLNTLVAEKGSVSHALLGRKSQREQIRVVDQYGIRGTYDTHTGQIEIAPEIFRDAKRFLSGKDKSARAASGVKTLIHETLHAHSPMGLFAYYRHGKWIEEATVELGARRILRETFGVDTKAKDLVQSYQAPIEHIRETVANALGVQNDDAIEDLITDAAFDMRKTDKTFDAADAYLQHFVDHLAIDASKRDLVFDKLKAALEKYNGL